MSKNATPGHSLLQGRLVFQKIAEEALSAPHELAVEFPVQVSREDEKVAPAPGAPLASHFDRSALGREMVVLV